MGARSFFRSVPLILLMLLSGVAVLSALNPAPGYAAPNPTFSGWAGGCTSGSHCSGGESVGFTCTAATCGSSVSGSGDGQFNGPSGVAVESSGNKMYGVDTLNNRVENFSGGVFSGWAGGCSSGSNCDTTGGADHSDGFTCTAATCTGPVAGSGDGQFDNPTGVAVDSSGNNVYVVDTLNDRVELFSGGVFSGWAGACGGGSHCSNGASVGFTCTAATCLPVSVPVYSGDGQFDNPYGVAVDSSGNNVYVADGDNDRVDLFSGGVFSGWAGGCTSGPHCSGGESVGFTCTAATCGTSESGTGDGQFVIPNGVAIDSSGNVYVVDLYNARVELFSGGVFSGWAGGCTSGPHCSGGESVGFTCTAATCGSSVSGSGDGQFNDPQGIAVDSSDHVYVTDFSIDGSSDRVDLFSGGVFSGWAGGCSGGSHCSNAESVGFTCTAATCGTAFASGGDGQFSRPQDVGCSGNNVYVSDNYNERVDLFGNGGGSSSTTTSTVTTAPPVAITSVALASPGNGAALTGTYVTLSGTVSASSKAVLSKVQVYLRFWSANHSTQNSTTICPIQNATATGTFSCSYEVTGPGLFTWNATAEGNPGGTNMTATATTRNSAYFTFTATPVVEEIPLLQGWNLISTPIIPASTSLSTVLASQIAGGNFTVIWSYQNGKWLEATLSGGKLSGTLTAFQDGFGYWIYMSRADHLFVVGSNFAVPPATPPSYQLGVGWNLLGFTPESTVGSEATSTYLSSLSGNYNRIYLYNNSLGTWTENPTSLTAGEAIWVYATVPATLRP